MSPEEACVRMVEYFEIAMRGFTFAGQNIQSETESAFNYLRPKMVRDGNQWCALYGEDIQSGVCGFGDSPQLAKEEFDRAWHKKIEREVCGE